MTTTPQGTGTWTPTFVAFLAYTFILVTYKLGVATVVMALAVYSVLLLPSRIRMPPFMWLFAAWLAWAGLGYFTTPHPEHVGPALWAHAKVFVVTLVAINALRTTTQVRYFTVFLVAMFVLVPVRATLVNYLTGYRLFGRAVGPFIYGNPNDLAALTILVLGAALALWAGSHRRDVARWFGLVSAIPLLLTIVLTQSRGAFLAVVGMALPSGVALVRHRPRLVPVFAALIGIALYIAPDSFWDRVGGLRKGTNFETIAEMDPEGSARERLAVLQTAVRIVADHPVLGVGLGAYAFANAEYSPEVGVRDTHNTYVNILAETGLPGLVLFLCLVFSVLRSAQDALRLAARTGRSSAEGLRWLQYGVVGLLIAGVFGSFGKFALLYVFFALVWSAARAIQEDCLEAVSAEAPSPLNVNTGVAAM